MGKSTISMAMASIAFCMFTRPSLYFLSPLKATVHLIHGGPHLMVERPAGAMPISKLHSTSLGKLVADLDGFHPAGVIISFTGSQKLGFNGLV